MLKHTVINNTGRHANHSLFWSIMHSQEGDVQTAAITQAMNKHLGIFDAFKTTFMQAALTLFGSGWTWLSMTADKKLCGKFSQSRFTVHAWSYTDFSFRCIGTWLLLTLPKPSSWIYYCVLSSDSLRCSQWSLCQRLIGMNEHFNLYTFRLRFLVSIILLTGAYLHLQPRLD